MTRLLVVKVNDGLKQKLHLLTSKLRQAKALIWSPEQEKINREGSMNDEQRTMSIIAEMSSDILDCLTFTWDSPSCNKDGKMPLLDTQTWVGLERREKGLPTALGDTPRLTKVGTLKPIVLFQFYKKPMSNQTPNLMRSGLPEGSKRATVTNEIHRHLKNTSRELETSIVSKILREYMDELERGGYPIKWREEVLYAALIGYKRMWEAECSGKGHVNRPEQFTQTKRRAVKLTGSRREKKVRK